MIPFTMSNGNVNGDANDNVNANKKAIGLTTDRFCYIANSILSAIANLKMQAGKCKCKLGNANAILTQVQIGKCLL